MEGLDFLGVETATRAPAPTFPPRASTASSATPEPSAPRVRTSTVVIGAVAAGGAVVAARLPLVGSLVGIAAGSLVNPSPLRAILGAVAVAAFPLAAVPICAGELWILGTHLRRDPRGTAAAILGLDRSTEGGA